MPSVKCRLTDHEDAVRTAEKILRYMHGGTNRRMYLIMHWNGYLGYKYSKYFIKLEQGDCCLGYFVCRLKTRTLVAHGPLLPTMLDEWFEIFEQLGWKLVIAKEKP